jgi:hypothetical protein
MTFTSLVPMLPLPCAPSAAHGRRHKERSALAGGRPIGQSVRVLYAVLRRSLVSVDD